MRFRPTHRTIYNAQPFAGQGVSLYVTIGNSVLYREQCLMCGSGLGTIPTGEKTTRIDSVSSPASNITVPEDPDWLGEAISIDIRTFKDDVENESTNWQTITLDGGGAPVIAIEGAATFLDATPRVGGVVRLRFVWVSSPTGLQPVTFTAIRTAGPTSPANAVKSAGPRIIEIDTPALSDAAPYTYKIRATNGAVTRDILTGIVFTADATGPVAPTVIAREW